jgi:DNA-binding MarR family transcriptional regulator
MSARRSSSEEVVVAALAARRDATAAELAEVTGLGRSTVGKVLAGLERRRRVHRRVGGRDGGHRLPDRWALAGSRKPARRQANGGRLRPGELDGLVLAYLAKHAQSAPLSPSGVAKGLGRSAGAVGNCLARLAAAGDVRLVSERPRRYSPV